jgi:hypothetical protein
MVMKKRRMNRISLSESPRFHRIGPVIAVFEYFSLKKILFSPLREPRFIFGRIGLRLDPGLPNILQITPFLRKTLGR